MKMILQLKIISYLKSKTKKCYNYRLVPLMIEKQHSQYFDLLMSKWWFSKKISFFVKILYLVTTKIEIISKILKPSIITGKYI